MDWPSIGLTAAVSWFVLLLVTDVAALLHVSPALAARAHSATFFAALAAIFVFGYVVFAHPHAVPCAQKVRLR